MYGWDEIDENKCPLYFEDCEEEADGVKNPMSALATATGMIPSLVINTWYFFVSKDYFEEKLAYTGSNAMYNGWFVALGSV